MGQCCERLQPQGIKDGSDWEGQGQLSRGRGNRWGLGESGTFNASQHCSQAAFRPSAVFALISAGSCKMKHTSPQGFTAVEEVSLDERRRLYNAPPPPPPKTHTPKTPTLFQMN